MHRSGNIFSVLMNDQVEFHLKRLREVANAPIPVVESGQFHRYYWMSECQVPALLNEEIHSVRKLRTDYDNSCHDVKKYWRRISADSSDRENIGSVVSDSSCRASSAFSVIRPDVANAHAWKSFCKRDHVSQIMRDSLLSDRTPQTLYGESYSSLVAESMSREFHIKANPISKFGEALVIQKNVMRA